MRIAIVWIVLAGTYVLFVGSFSAHEALACAISAALATLWWHRVARRGGARFAIEPGGLVSVARAAAGMPARTFRVAAHLARAALAEGALGSTRTRPLSAMGWPGATLDDREGTGGRALGTFAASLAPDSYVLRVDTAGGEVVEHVLGVQSRRGKP